MSGQSLVTPGLRNRVRGMAEPIALGLGRLGLTPNHLTLIGFAVAIIAAVAAANQAWLAAGLLVIGGGVFDLFDGALARATGRVNRLGAFFDSVFDRWGESVVYLGIVWGTLDMGLWRPVVLAAAAMGAAFMVSYSRAKSEALGFTEGNGMAAIGLAPREIRLVILTTGLIVAGLATGVDGSSFPRVGEYPLAGTALEVSLGLIAVLATITTIQRVLHVRSRATADATTTVDTSITDQGTKQEQE